MQPVPVELQFPELSLEDPNCSRFFNLRGVRWRINLGILPFSPSASIEELRRAAADCRRRYASLRRHLLIDPHLPRDGSRSPDLTMDNPLSQNPESTWGRFFRNAELEKLLDQDLSRLYPEHENFFQTPSCQAMLRRILLVWCLRHSEYGYRQGMHELLAPLLYVLHIDLQSLSQIRAPYEDCFTDEFDEMNFPEGDLDCNRRLTKSSSRGSRIDNDNYQEEGNRCLTKSSSGGSRIGNDNFQEEGNPEFTTLDDLDPEIKELLLLNDAYGAEGELGVILSERFVEHDAYCMFDGLMSRSHGVVAMAEFFSPSPIGSGIGLLPVIEASSALYHLLSIVDSSLHNHLIELGVEPQYFALRWLRVLFGREFSLDDLLLIWDELLSSSNTSVIENELEASFKILCSPRGSFITAMAVSMLLHLRSSLLATENATSCLKRLLNFPKIINVKKMIEKAKSLQALGLEKNISSIPSQNSLKPQVSRVHSLPPNAASPRTPNQSLPDSYWEEKWRVLHKDLASQKNGGDAVSHGQTSKLLGDKFGLTRTASVPSSAKKDSQFPTVRRQLLNDLIDVNSEMKSGGNEKLLPEEQAEQPIVVGVSDYTEETCMSAKNSSEFSMANSPHGTCNDPYNNSESSSALCNDPHDDSDSIATSNFFVPDNADEANQVDILENGITSIVNAVVTSTNKVGPSKDRETEQGLGVKYRKPLSGKFLWRLRFGKGFGEGNAEKGSSNVEHVGKQKAVSSTSDNNSCDDRLKVEVGEKKVMGTLKCLGQSMLENIQVIESVFQQEQGLTGSVIGVEGQATTMAALEELRKISNLLSEM